LNIIVISSSAPFGKGESFVVEEVNALAEKGVTVTLFPTILRKGNPNRFNFHKNIKIGLYPIFSMLGLSAVFRLAVSDIKLLSRLIKLSAGSGLKNLLKNLAVLPKSILIAGYARNNGVVHIHAHWLTASATLAMMVSLQTGIPWSVTAHRGDIVSANALQKKFDSASFVRFISASGVALASARARLDDKKIRVLHMGVQVPTDGFRCCLGGEPTTLTVLCPANLLPVKGHEVLLKALSRMKFQEAVRLELAGDGQLRSRLEQTAKKLGVNDKVVFLGHIPHGDLIDAYRNSEVDIVVLPSLDLGNGLHEGIPVSLMEAMALRVPVVSTLTGGIPELLVDSSGEHAGLLVPAGDAQALAKALDQLVASPEMRVNLGLLGRERVTREFNQDLISAELIRCMS